MRALAARCSPCFREHLVPPDKNIHTFANLPYFVDEEAQGLLFHTGLLALLGSPKALPQASTTLPEVGRILLQVHEVLSGKITCVMGKTNNSSSVPVEPNGTARCYRAICFRMVWTRTI